MSTTVTISGNSSTLSANFNPPIYLDDDKDYLLGIADFETFMTIPNIEEGCNKIYIGNKIITIPEGSYEIRDLEKSIKTILSDHYSKDKLFLLLQGDPNTLKTTIKCTQSIDFTPDDSIGKLLGFNKKIIPANTKTISDNVTAILKVNAICIDCNIVTGSYHNGKPVHIIHQFFPSVSPGYKIVESPLPILYFPVSVKTINNITVKVLDQDNNLINFRGETITVRLHMKTETTSNGY